MCTNYKVWRFAIVSQGEQIVSNVVNWVGMGVVIVFAWIVFYFHVW
jgi:hypothetical protein